MGMSPLAFSTVVGLGQNVCEWVPLHLASSGIYHLLFLTYKSDRLSISCQEEIKLGSIIECIRNMQPQKFKGLYWTPNPYMGIRFILLIVIFSHQQAVSCQTRYNCKFTKADSQRPPWYDRHCTSSIFMSFFDFYPPLCNCSISIPPPPKVWSDVMWRSDL